jgi:DNA transformation protein and related proteins
MRRAGRARTGRARRVASAEIGGTAVRADLTFLTFVLEQLHGLGEVESRAMFGGHGLYAGGVFFAIVHHGRLYFRVDDATRQDYESCGMQPFRPRTRQTLGRYFEVPTDVLESPAEAARWARGALKTQVPEAKLRR